MGLYAAAGAILIGLAVALGSLSSSSTILTTSSGDRGDAARTGQDEA